VAHMSSDDASGMLHAAAIAVNSSAPLPLGIGQNAVNAGVALEYPEVRAAFARASVASKVSGRAAFAHGCFCGLQVSGRAAFARASVAWQAPPRPPRHPDPALGVTVAAPRPQRAATLGAQTGLLQGPHLNLAAWGHLESKHFARTNRSRPR
jgi:hypothetical protein